MSQRHCLLAALVASSCSSGTWVRICYAGASCRCLRTSARSPVVPPAPAMLFVSSTAATMTGVAHIFAPQFGPASLFANGRRGSRAHGVTRTGRPVYTGVASTAAIAQRRRLDRTHARGWPIRWWHWAQSRSRRLGAQWRLLALSHDWRALLVAMMHWRYELFAWSDAGP